MASLGDLIIKVGGDIAGFKSAMSDASASADRFATQITESVARGTVIFDAYGNAIQVATQHTIAAAEAGTAGAAAAEQLAEAHAHAVSEIQATSGALRVLEGSGGLRAAERFLATTLNLGPALQAIFPIVGAIAFAEMLGKIGEEIYKAMSLSANAKEVIGGAFREINNALELTNDQLRVSNDRIENQIAKLQRRPENALKEALDEARLAADNLASALDQDLGRIYKVISENKPKWWQIFTPGASDLQKQLGGKTGAGGFRGDLAQMMADGTEKIREATTEEAKQAAQADLSAKANKAYADEIGNVAAKLGQLKDQQKRAADRSSYNAAIEIYKGTLRQLQEEQQQIQLRGTQATDEAQRAAAQAQHDALENSKRAVHDQQEMLKGGYAQMLAEQESSDQLSIQDKIAFFENELAEVQQYGNKYMGLQREIKTEIGKLNQQAFAEGKRLQDEDVRGQERLQDALRRTALEFQKYFNERMKAQQKFYAEEGKNPYEPRPDLPQFAINVNPRSRLPQGVKDALSTNQAGMKTEQYQQAQIENEKELLALAERANVPLGEQLTQREKILQSEIALGEQQGKDVSAQIIALNALKVQQGQLKTQADGMATLYLKISGEISGFKNSLGNTLSAGIFSGKGIAQEIENSLKKVGQNILGGVFQKAIDQMVASLGLNTAGTALLNSIMGIHTAATTGNTAVTTAHAGVMLSHAGVMLTHLGATIAATVSTIANTAATVLNTFWLSIKSFFSFLGFADGGSPPVGVPSIIGERGPEVFWPHTLGTVISNSSVRSALAGGAGASVSSSAYTTVQVVNNFHGVTNGRDIARTVMQTLKTAGGPRFSPGSS